MNDEDRPAEEHKPDDIEENLKEPARSAHSGSPPEGPERKASEFERLNAKRNTDDGDAHDEAANCVTQGKPNAGENEPKDVADSLHLS